MEAKKKTSNKFSSEVRARAVRMAQERRGDHASQWAAIASIAAKIGCTGETLRNWIRQAERDAGVRPGATTDERERIKALERENRELRQANEILRKASAYFAQAELRSLIMISDETKDLFFPRVRARGVRSALPVRRQAVRSRRSPPRAWMKRA